MRLFFSYQRFFAIYKGVLNISSKAKGDNKGERRERDAGGRAGEGGETGKG